MFALICYSVSNKRTCMPERYTKRLRFKHAAKDCGSNRYKLQLTRKFAVPNSTKSHQQRKHEYHSSLKP